MGLTIPRHPRLDGHATTGTLRFARSEFAGLLLFGLQGEGQPGFGMGWE